MAEYRQEWESEIDEIFLSDNLEEIVDGTRLFFREMKLETSQEQEKIWYWLACAYRHREVSRTPFFPILFLYAVCENEDFAEERITRYMGYAARYIYVKQGDAQSNSQSKESELRNGWLQRHMDQLPQEHQKVARIYLEVVDYLFAEDEAESEDDRDNWKYKNSTEYWKKEDHGDYTRWEDNWQDLKKYDSWQDSGKSDDSQDMQEDDRDFSMDEGNGKKKGASKKGLLIGLIAGLLIGITLGCTGTALILNGYLGKREQTNTSQTDISQSNLPEKSSSDASPSDTSDTASQKKTLPESSENSLPSGDSSSNVSSDTSSSDVLPESTPSDIPSEPEAGGREESGNSGHTDDKESDKESDGSSGGTDGEEVF